MRTRKICSEIILENKEAIISEWEHEVRKKVSGAGLSSSLALRNQLSDLLDDIAAIFLDRLQFGYDYKSNDYLRTVEKNKHHGKLRAETEHYTIDQVIQEYFILQRIVRTFLQEKGGYDEEVGLLLNSIFESTILHSSASFSDSIQDIQDKLVGTLTHDIRNPLTTALSAVELMAVGANGNEKIVQLAKKSLERSIHLTEGLLDSISIKSGQGMLMHFSQGDYVKLIQEVGEEASVSYQREITCEVPDSVVGIFDPISVRRLLDNLLSNAVKHGRSNTTIKIILEETDKEVIISVVNFGTPISVDKMESIFSFLKHDHTPEHTAGKSWGMGLTLVKLIADAHEGSVSLTSSEQNGTRFTVRLKKVLKYSGKVRMKL